MNSTDLTGYLLIALPTLEDSNFANSVVYIASHSDEGAMGLVLNQPSTITIGQVFEQLEIQITALGAEEEPVFSGGPVQQEQGFVLHSPELIWEHTLPINDFSALTSSRDILEAIAQGAGPGHYRMMLGHAGWGAGQLEGELAEDAWLTAPASPELLFETPFTDLREAAASALGVDMTLLVGRGGHA
ncbi:YqgE/AlgH family protein [Thiohalorhabdus sp.]|uniref:YqgE/AlgH family protein n=1 Tax=Thiohalorhabdus sp. TaxID=3094134 RepID=UPI002FC2F355